MNLNRSHLDCNIDLPVEVEGQRVRTRDHYPNLNLRIGRRPYDDVVLCIGGRLPPCGLARYSGSRSGRGGRSFPAGRAGVSSVGVAGIRGVEVVVKSRKSGWSDGKRPTGRVRL